MVKGAPGVTCVVSVVRSGCNTTESSQRTHDAMITSLLRQNDVATSFWRNNDVIITSCVHWNVSFFLATANIRDCVCPEECSIYTYSLQQSSASLALLGLQQLLQDMEPSVEQSYHHAINQNDRMQPDNFYITLNLLESVIDKMEGKQCGPYTYTTRLLDYGSTVIFPYGNSKRNIYILTCLMVIISSMGTLTLTLLSKTHYNNEWRPGALLLT